MRAGMQTQEKFGTFINRHSCMIEFCVCVSGVFVLYEFSPMMVQYTEKRRYDFQAWRNFTIHPKDEIITSLKSSKAEDFICSEAFIADSPRVLTRHHNEMKFSSQTGPETILYFHCGNDDE